MVRKPNEALMQQIRALRERGLSQKQIAEEIHRSPQLINYYFGKIEAEESREAKEAEKQELLNECTLASEAFKLFEEGKGPTDVVIQLDSRGVTPSKASKLYKIWCQEREMVPPHSLSDVLKRIEAVEEKFNKLQEDCERRLSELDERIRRVAELEKNIRVADDNVKEKLEALEQIYASIAQILCSGCRQKAIANIGLQYFTKITGIKP